MNSFGAIVKKTSTNREAARLAVLVVVLAVFALAVGPSEYLSGSNFRAVFFSVSIIALIAVGQAAVLLTRNLDLSVASVLALTAYVAAKLTQSQPDLTLVGVAAITICVGLALGLVNGVLVGWAGLPSIIVTLATLSIFRGLMYLVSDGVRVSTADSLTRFGVSQVLGVPTVAWFAVAVAVFMAVWLRWSTSGRDLYAVGSSPESARVAGVPIGRRICLAFTVSGGLAGLAGFLYAGLYAGVQMDSAIGVEFAVITAAVLGGVSVFGGVGTVLGTVLGALIVGFVNNGLTLLNLDPAIQTAFQGIAIIAVVTADALILRMVDRRALAQRRTTRRGAVRVNHRTAPTAAHAGTEGAV